MGWARYGGKALAPVIEPALLQRSLESGKPRAHSRLDLDLSAGVCAGLGDVAITPYSVNWQCKLASWSEQCTGFPNVCTYPVEEAGPVVT